MGTDNVQEAGRRQSTLSSQNAEKLSAAKHTEIFKVSFKTYLPLFTVPVRVKFMVAHPDSPGQTLPLFSTQVCRRLLHHFCRLQRTSTGL